MHSRNGDRPYKSSLDAMSYLPEKETAVAIRKLMSGDLECVAAFGVDSLFDFKITHNPKRQYHVFNHRVKSKGWLEAWPELSVVYRTAMRNDVF